MDAHVLSSLDNLESKINNVLTSLTTSPTAAGAPAATLALLDADDALSSALETLRTHQANYTKILKLRAEAEQLEERVKGIVRDIEGVGKEISTVCGDEVEDETDTDSDVDSDDDTDYASEKSGDKGKSTRRGKEVDYKLLLDFARRISRYNQQAAADAAAGAPPVKKRLQGEKQADGDTEMTGINGEHAEGEAAQPVGAVTKEATAWLDESAKMARAMYMMPFPAEDRIRLGLMAQIHLAATERGIDPEQEVERLVREAEGVGIAEPVTTENKSEQRAHAIEASRAAERVGSISLGGGAGAPVAAPAPKPKATLDLDLYDPDDDEI